MNKLTEYAGFNTFIMLSWYFGRKEEVELT